MRWILEWLLGGLRDRRARELQRLRSGLVRVRRRRVHHGECLQAAEAEFVRGTHRVEFLEMSEDAAVEELVDARRSLVALRQEMEHHDRRLKEAQAMLSRMHGDRRRLRAGEEPEHWESYLDDLDP
jgi:chromosome segregation ATPase